MDCLHVCLNVQSYLIPWLYVSHVWFKTGNISMDIPAWYLLHCYCFLIKNQRYILQNKLIYQYDVCQESHVIKEDKQEACVSSTPFSSTLRTQDHYYTYVGVFLSIEVGGGHLALFQQNTWPRKGGEPSLNKRLASLKLPRSLISCLK